MKANHTKQGAMSVMRIGCLLVIFGVALLALMGNPLDDDPWWFEKFLISKTIAAAGFYISFRLYDRWKKIDKWIKAYDKSCEEALEAPNPLYIGKEDDQ